MPAWLIGGTRQRKGRFCASGWEETKEGAAVWWRSPKDGKLALISGSPALSMTRSRIIVGIGVVVVLRPGGPDLVPVDPSKINAA